MSVPAFALPLSRMPRRVPARLGRRGANRAATRRGSAVGSYRRMPSAVIVSLLSVWGCRHGSIAPRLERGLDQLWMGPDPETLKRRHQVWPDFHHAPDLEASGRIVEFLPAGAADAFSLRG